MLGKKIVLWNENEYEKKSDKPVPYMDLYLLPKIEYDSTTIEHSEKRPIVVICPGGGYEFLSERESEPIALKYLSRGFNAAVVHYSIRPYAYPQALLDVAKAILTIRENAEEYHVDPEKIIVAGFSAGGHLAGSIATMWHEPFLAEKLGVDGNMLKPNVQMLGYPVISSKEFGHQGSFDVIALEDKALRASLSLETRVSDKTPPAYIWHTATDDCVPVMNALVFAEALTKNGVNYEMHIFPRGCHGLAIAEKETAVGAPELCNDYITRWVDESTNFINMTLSK